MQGMVATAAECIAFSFQVAQKEKLPFHFEGVEWLFRGRGVEGCLLGGSTCIHANSLMYLYRYGD